MKTVKKSIIAAGALFLLMSNGPVMAADQETADSSTALRTQDRVQDRIDQDYAVRGQDQLRDRDQLQEQSKLQERTRTRTRTQDRLSRPDVSSSRPDVSSSRPDFSRPSTGTRQHSR